MLGVDREQTVNIAKPLQLRARYFHFATLILSRTAPFQFPDARKFLPGKLFLPALCIAYLRVRRDAQKELRKKKKKK